MIGFSCLNIDKLDELFERFLYVNRERIVNRGYHSCELDDGTIIKKIYNIENMSKYYVFDQFIFGGEIVLTRLREPFFRKIIKWNESIPEEFRILYWNKYAD